MHRLRRVWALRTVGGAILLCLLGWLLKLKTNKLEYLQAASSKHNQSPNLTTPSYAYATLLCDDVMSDAVKVLIYSLKKTTKLPFLILVLPAVTQRKQLEELGAEIHEITMLDYPFRVTAEKAAINKMCRYSKLHIWKFTQYKKVIFIDVDTIVLQSLDGAFRWPEFSAVRDAGDTFNTGLFVLEPSIQTWKDMLDCYPNAPSYNQGDQGFINWYFRKHPKTALPVRYNTVCKHRSHAVWPLLKRQAKMVHFTSETKPWNFFASSHKYWRQNFDAGMFYLWSKTFRLVARQLHIDVFDATKGMWVNNERACEICERYYPTIENNDIFRPASIDDKLSIVIIRWKSTKSLLAVIAHYRLVVEPLIHKIYISWNPSLGIPNIEIARLKFLASGPPIEILTHRYESVNNIWNPIIGLETKAVLLADDEHLPDLERLEVAFRAWKNNQNGLVGFFARYHYKQRITIELSSPLEDFNSTTGNNNEASNLTVTEPIDTRDPINTKDSEEHHQWIYNLTNSRRPRPYSLLSSQMLILSSEYFFIYTCLLPDRIHRFIDDQTEDISDFAMNLLVTGMTGSRPLLVKSDYVDPENGRFAGDSWALTRGNLLKKLVNIFSGGKDPLLFSSISVAQFNKIPFKKRSIKQWNKHN